MSPDTLPQEMTAVAISTPGPPDVLLPVRRPLPSPHAGEVLIRVAAAGVNRPDLLQRLGKYPAPPGTSDLPGLEVAGHVVGLGEGVSWPAIGMRVAALLSGGGYAEYCTARAAHCLVVPDSLPLAEAAALPEAIFTVWVNVFDLGRLAFGEHLLVHGGASGIGSTATRMAKAFGARVAVTASGPARTEACRALGADLAVDYQSQDFVGAVREWTNGRGVDVILDMVGGSYLARNLDALAEGGRLVQIAILGGARGEVNLLKVMQKRLTLTGSTLRSRDDAFKARVCGAVAEQVWPHVVAGRIRPLIHATFPLAEAAQAHAALETGGHVGKVVLLVE